MLLSLHSVIIVRKMSVKHIVIDARGRQSSSGRYVDRLIEHLQPLDTFNRYTILLKPGDNWQAKAANFSRQQCHFKQFSFNPLDQVTFARFLKGLKPDLVHFWMTPQEPLFYRGKRITTTHDLTMLRFSRAGRLPLPLHWLRMAGYRLLFWHSHRTARAVLVPTQYVKQDVIALHPFTNNKVIVTLEACEPPLNIRSVPLKGVQKPYIMHVGSPFPHKNIERLVEAFGLLKTTHPDLQLVLAGKKELYFEQLEKTIMTNKFQKDIILPGFVSDAELKWLYENASAYVLPSLSEGFGLPGLEAMVNGTPVVSSNLTCLPEVYGDAAVYFDPTKPRAIGEAIAKVINDKLTSKKLVARGYKQVARYSWRRMAQQTLEVYNSVLQ